MATHGVRPTRPTWGTHWEDYRAREKAKLKRSNSAQPNRINKRKKASRRALQVPNLADTLDEYNKFTQLLINDESDTESEVDPDTNESFTSMEDLGQTLDPCLIEGLFQYIKEEAGPPPDIESLPISYQDDVRHHDECYMSIMNAIFFFHADNTPSDEVHGSIYSRAMLYWLKANSGEKGRNLISEFLLHPHIRSLRCRAVMGRHDWGQLFEELES